LQNGPGEVTRDLSLYSFTGEVTRGLSLYSILYCYSLFLLGLESAKSGYRLKDFVKSSADTATTFF